MGFFSNNFRLFSTIILKLLIFRKHLKLHLYYRIADNNLDPLSLYGNMELKSIIRRNNLEVSNVENKSENEIRNIYTEVSD